VVHGTAQDINKAAHVSSCDAIAVPFRVPPTFQTVAPPRVRTTGDRTCLLLSIVTDASQAALVLRSFSDPRARAAGIRLRGGSTAPAHGRPPKLSALNSRAATWKLAPACRGDDGFEPQLSDYDLYSVSIETRLRPWVTSSIEPRRRCYRASNRRSQS